MRRQMRWCTTFIATDFVEFRRLPFLLDLYPVRMSIFFFSGRDRELYFPAYYFFAERRLINHTIKSLLVRSLDDCEYLCYLDDNCVSLNIKNNKNGTHSCELNNSTHLEHDADLVNSAVFYYRGAKVIMTSKISTVLLHLFELTN